MSLKKCELCKRDVETDQNDDLTNILKIISNGVTLRWHVQMKMRRLSIWLLRGYEICFITRNIDARFMTRCITKLCHDCILIMWKIKNKGHVFRFIVMKNRQEITLIKGWSIQKGMNFGPSKIGSSLLL